MNEEEENTNDPAWPAAVAQASAWIALLHGPRRMQAVERGLQSWLAESAMHREAFELATDTWNEHRALVRNGAGVKLLLPGERDERNLRIGWMSAAAALCLVAMVFCTYTYTQRNIITTQADENQRVIELADASVISLKGASKLDVDYEKKTRKVRFLSEDANAVFHVVKEADRPFSVAAGNYVVTARGTSFHVHLSAHNLTVTLLEGAVKISRAVEDADTQDGSGTHEWALSSPGARVTFTDNKPPMNDRADLDKLVGQHGMISMHKTKLVDAIAQMNRYSTLQLGVEGQVAPSTEISGIFRIGEPRQFANAIKRRYGFELENKGDDRILIVDGPQQMPGMLEAPANR